MSSHDGGHNEKAGGLGENRVLEIESSPEVRSVLSSNEENEHVCFVETGDGGELDQCRVVVRSKGSRGVSSGRARREDVGEAAHPDEVHPDFRAGQPRVDLQEVGGAWRLLEPVPASYQPVREILPPAVSFQVTRGDDVGRLEDAQPLTPEQEESAWEDFHSNELDEVIQAMVLLDDDDPRDPEGFRIDMNVGLEDPASYGPRHYLPDGRDYYQEGYNHFVVHHVEPRRRFFVPFPNFGHECELDVNSLSGERMTICKHFGPQPHGWIRRSQYYDNFRSNDDADPDLWYWVGYTVLAKNGTSLTWEDESGDLPDDDDDFNEEEEAGPGDRGCGGGDEEGEEEETVTSSTSYGTSRSRSCRRAGGGVDKLETLAREYIQVINTLGVGTVTDWEKVLTCGDALLSAAGSVEGAARALWDARKENSLDNLKGVNSPELDAILHPLLLEYLRSVEENGMVARHPGSDSRVSSGLHPNAKLHLNQVYKQIFKDVKKHRVLVTKQGNSALGPTVSSPFEAVDKMMPDRSIAPDKRVVHDQRRVNQLTHKDWHPPALQPTHQQIARRILWYKTRYPGIEVVISKRDIAGAFRLLWIAPEDAHLFAGDLPWKPEVMEEACENGENIDGARNGHGDITVIYLVSSFGFSGSPGEWTAFGRATEEYHRAHAPGCARRDGAVGFDSKILVDDMVLVEPVLGMRPWVSASCYEHGVRLMLGHNAVNEEKNLIEGAFKEEQTIWGLNMNTETELASLPARRIEKGAHLLAEPAFDFDAKVLNLRKLQQFRGITTGWAVVVRGLTRTSSRPRMSFSPGEMVLCQSDHECWAMRMRDARQIEHGKTYGPCSKFAGGCALAPRCGRPSFAQSWRSFWNPKNDLVFQEGIVTLCLCRQMQRLRWLERSTGPMGHAPGWELSLQDHGWMRHFKENVTKRRSGSMSARCWHLWPLRQPAARNGRARLSCTPATTRL